MSVRSALLRLTAEVAGRLSLPAVAGVFIPDPRPSPDSDAEFGLVTLEDGVAGLYYAWMGGIQAEMATRYSPAAFTGMPALELARYYARDNDADRSLGLAAINAITQFVYKKAGFELPAAADSMAGLALDGSDHFGLVGNFPSLIRRARAQSVRCTVIERKAHMVDHDELVTITLDAAAIGACNKVVCTAATLINDTLDGVSEHFHPHAMRVLLGPTAGCFPDPIFARGFERIGGSAIVDAPLAQARLESGQKLGSAIRRFTLDAADYPTVDALLARATR